MEPVQVAESNAVQSRSRDGTLTQVHSTRTCVAEGGIDQRWIERMAQVGLFRSANAKSAFDAIIVNYDVFVSRLKRIFTNCVLTFNVDSASRTIHRR